MIVGYTEWLAPRPRADGGTLLVQYRYPMAGEGAPPLVGEFSAHVDAGPSHPISMAAGLGARVSGQAVEVRRPDFRPTADLVVDVEIPAWKGKGEEGAKGRAPARLYTAPASGDDDGGGTVLVRTEAPGASGRRGRCHAGARDRHVGEHRAGALRRRASARRCRALWPRSARPRGGARRRPDRAPRGPRRDRARGRGPQEGRDGCARRALAGRGDGPGPRPRGGRRRACSGGLASEPWTGRRAHRDGGLRGRRLADGRRRDGRSRRGAPRPAQGRRASARRRRRRPPRQPLRARRARPRHRPALRDRRAARTPPAPPSACSRRRCGPPSPASRSSFGPEVERIYPRGPRAVAAGDTVAAVGRFRGDPPREITLVWRDASGAHEERRPLVEEETVDPADVTRRWAAARVKEIALNGRGREAATDVALHAGLLTPWTGWRVGGAEAYVPSRLATRILDLSGRRRAASRRPSPRRAAPSARSRASCTRPRTTGPTTRTTR